MYKTILRLALGLSLFAPGAASAVSNMHVDAFDHGNGQPKEVRASGYIAAPPAKVWKVITDYGSYQTFMPRVAQSRLDSRRGNLAVATIHLNVPFPFNGTWYTNRYQENPRALSLSWQMLNGSIKSTTGGWVLKPSGSGTSVVYTIRTDLGGVMIPKMLQDEITKRTMPDIFAAVERRALALR